MFKSLLRPLVLAGSQDLLTPLKIVPHVGVVAILDFLYHFAAMAVYTVLSNAVGPVVSSMADGMRSRDAFLVRLQVEAWRFGADLDYDHE